MAACKTVLDDVDLVASLETLSEDQLEEMCTRDPKSLVTALLRELKASHARVHELGRQLEAKDHELGKMKEEESAYRLEINKLKRELEEAHVHIGKLNDLIERMGTYVGELRLELDEHRNESRSQIALSESVARVALEEAREARLISRDTGMELAAVMSRLERLEEIHNFDENHEHYGRGHAHFRQNEAHFQSTPQAETGASTPESLAGPTYRPPPGTRGFSSEYESPFHRAQALDDSQLGRGGGDGTGSSPETQNQRHAYGYTLRNESSVTRQMHILSIRATETRVTRTTMGSHSSSFDQRGSSDTGVGSSLVTLLAEESNTGRLPVQEQHSLNPDQSLAHAEEVTDNHLIPCRDQRVSSDRTTANGCSPQIVAGTDGTATEGNTDCHSSSGPPQEH